MKKITKLLSIMMVLALVLALGAQAFAANVTITKPEDGVTHQYTAFQVFSGTQNAESGNKLASIEWGDGINETAFVTALADKYPEVFSEGMTAEKVAEGLSAESVDAAEVAKIAATCTKGEGKALTDGENELADGYYLIKDTTPEDQLRGSAAYNDVMLQATGTINVTWKSDVPSSKKKVQDNESTTWQDSADWDIGDEVPFQITGTLPSNYGDYDTYYVAFHDKQEAGLSNPAADSFKVTVDGTQLTSGYEVKIPGEDGCTFDVIITDLKTAAPSAAAGSVIEVTYKSVLNSDAKIGPEGNKNISHMEFSNNPNGEQHGNTKDDTVIVFTYELDVDKVTGEGENKHPLAGAGFTLLKEVDAIPEGSVTLSKLDDKDENLKAGSYYSVDGKNYVIVGVIGATESGTDFDFKGLDDGSYLLVETTVPDGYNKAEDVAFSISATHETESDNPKLLTFTATGEGVSANEEEGSVSGKVMAEVVNNSGLELPETGGIGTTIFYVVGAILVAGAVILLVTKKRMSGADK